MSIYRPEKYEGPIVQNATLAVKFSQRTFLMRSFLDQWKIPYKEEDLEECGPFLGIYLDRDEADNKKRAQQEKANS